MAIIVSPITLSDTPNAFAISVPDSTRSLAPTVMAAALSTNNDEFIKTCFLVGFIIGIAGRITFPLLVLRTEFCFDEERLFQVNIITTPKARRLPSADTVPFLHIIIRMNAEDMRHIIPNLKFLVSIVELRNIMLIAIIIAVLAVTDPTALPIAIELLPENVAMVETKISGKVVAILTIVAPIINFGMLNTSAIQTALSTNTSPPFIIKNRPTRKSKTVIVI